MNFEAIAKIIAATKDVRLIKANLESVYRKGWQDKAREIREALYAAGEDDV